MVLNAGQSTPQYVSILMIVRPGYSELLLLLLFLFGGVLSSHPGTYMKFSLITIYGSNVPSKPLSC